MDPRLAIAEAELAKAKLRAAHLRWAYEQEMILVEQGDGSEAACRSTELNSALADQDVRIAEAKLEIVRLESRTPVTTQWG